MAEAAGVSLRAVATGAVISSDRELLLSLLRKLVANAVKFTERGGVLLGCRRSGDRLRIQVWDTGRGMGEEAIAGLGTEFHQLHRVSGRGGPGRGESGFGFGLVVVQRLAAILGHPVGVRSVVGRGSMFEVVVPLIRVQT